MIAWTIKAALDSNLFSKVLVSTDCEEISKVSRKYGAEVPFLRTKNSDDFTEVSEAAVAGKVRAMRTGYATWLNLTKYFDSQVEEGQALITYNVTNEDMSGYV